MAKKFFSIPALAFLLLLLVVEANAQVRITGTVTGNDRQPVPFASIRITGAGSGAITDSGGRFSFITAAKGRQALAVTSIGFAGYSQVITIGNKNMQLHILLQKENQQLQGIVINAGDFEASDKATGASLTPMDVFTVAGNNADLAMGLRSLPGAQQVGEQAGLFVRGGTGEETKQFIDGMLMPYPNYNNVPGVLQPARINPILFKGILFSAGGYSALYGEAMSSALILNSIDFPRESSFYFNIFPPHTGTGFQTIATNKKSSYGLNLNYSNQAFLYNNIVPQKPGYTHGPEYLEGDANFRKQIGATGMLKFYANWSTSDVGMRNPDIDSILLSDAFRLKSRNLYANITYRQYLNDSWTISGGLAYDYNTADTRMQLLDQDNNVAGIPYKPYEYKNDRENTRSDFAQGRVVLTRSFSRGQSLNIGAEQFYTMDRFARHDSVTVLNDRLSAVFAEGEIRLSDHIAARIGGRFEYSSLLMEANLAPRIGLAYQFGKETQLDFAYGIFYQQPEKSWLYYDPHLRFTQAAHYILSFTHKADNRFFRAAAYYKKYDDLVKTEPALNNNGKGYAKGIELFWRDKKSFKNLEYWVSYTYLDTRRDYLDFPYALRPAFSSPHTATLAVKESIPAIGTYINISYAFAAGRPYYNIVDGSPGTSPAIADQGDTRCYSVANLQVAYMLHLFKSRKKPTYSGISAGVNNLFGTRQIFGYNYSYDGANKVPVTLPAPRYYYLGFWLSLDVDQTENILNNM